MVPSWQEIRHSPFEVGHKGSMIYMLLIKCALCKGCGWPQVGMTTRLLPQEAVIKLDAPTQTPASSSLNRGSIYMSKAIKNGKEMEEKRNL